MQFDVVDTKGSVAGQAELDETVWGIEPHLAVMHQALVRQQANARTGTSDTKTRGRVSGGGRKPWRQKGTGRARQGTTRAPQWIGGGVVFGPHPRTYVQAMPRQMRRLAIRSVLSAKLRDDRLTILKGMGEVEGRTKAWKDVLAALPESRSMLIVLPEHLESIERGCGNLPRTKTILAGMINVRDVLKFDRLVVAEEALPVIEKLWALPEDKREPSQWQIERRGASEQAAPEATQEAAEEVA